MRTLSIGHWPGTTPVSVVRSFPILSFFGSVTIIVSDTVAVFLALRTDASNMHMVGGSTGCLAQVVTDTFKVVQQSQYSAARE